MNGLHETKYVQRGINIVVKFIRHGDIAGKERQRENIAHKVTSNPHIGNESHKFPSLIHRFKARENFNQDIKKQKVANEMILRP